MKRGWIFLLFAGLLCAGLALGADSAYGGFDVVTGTGVLGVGQVQPPGLGTPPAGLAATIERVTSSTWDCVLIANPSDVAHQHGSIRETWTSVATVNTNGEGKVLNYRFDGWTYAKELITTSHTTDPTSPYYTSGFGYLLHPVCISSLRELRNLVTTVEELPLVFVPSD